MKQNAKMWAKIEAENEKAEKAKNQGQWTRGRWEVRGSGKKKLLKWIRPKFIPGPARLRTRRPPITFHDG
jgi:hypothetical protein